MKASHGLTSKRRVLYIELWTFKKATWRLCEKFRPDNMNIKIKLLSGKLETYTFFFFFVYLYLSIEELDKVWSEKTTTLCI